MLEDVLDGESPIEEKYLHNFTPEEKIRFKWRIKGSIKSLAKYQAKLDQLIAEDSPAIFRNNDPSVSSSAEEIKYALNRIEANDPRQTDLDLGPEDEVYHPDRLALDISKAFRNNTFCRIVVLSKLGLTAHGLDPILRALHHKDLLELDIRGNKVSESLPTLIHILDDPNTDWGQVRLGRIRLDPKQKKALEKHENVSFTALPPRQNMLQIVRNLFQKQ